MRQNCRIFKMLITNFPGLHQKMRKYTSAREESNDPWRIMVRAAISPGNYIRSRYAMDTDTQIAGWYR